MPELICLNGEIVPREEARVSIDDRGFLFGDGVYEVVRVYDNEPFCLDEHLDRFFFGVRGIEIAFHLERDELRDLLCRVAKESDLGGASLYWQVTRGEYSPRTHHYTAEMTNPTFFISTRKVESHPQERREKGVTVALEPDLRWLKCCYKTLNLLPNCIASTRARSKGAFEAVLYRDLDHVTECSRSSLFKVKDGVLSTHPEGDLILSGVTRGEIIKLCLAQGISVEEKPFSVKDLVDADEAFLTGTVSEVNPITVVEGAPLGTGRPGPLTKKIMEAFRRHTGQI